MSNKPHGPLCRRSQQEGSGAGGTKDWVPTLPEPCYQLCKHGFRALLSGLVLCLLISSLLRENRKAKEKVILSTGTGGRSWPFSFKKRYFFVKSGLKIMQIIQNFLYSKKVHLRLQEWITHPFERYSCILQKKY